jgi:hypothetical protein
MVDQKKFEELPFPQIKKWLNEQIQSQLFISVMDKHPVWRD